MAANPLDMALDEVISKTRTKQTNRSRPQQTHGRHNQTRDKAFSSPYARPRTNLTRTNSLVVANLHYNVDEKDLYELFSQVGPLKRAFLHLAPTGKSSGVADIIFANSGDAERAIKAYNNVELDERPMRITFSDNGNRLIVRQPLGRENGRRGALNNNNNSNNNNNNNNNRQHHRNLGNQGNRNRKEPKPNPSQAELDADMETYMSTAVVVGILF
ncbi:hypothetical protein BDF14DRAFT_1779346 [Spinellus fusiger]|nr:hypothetical protein BDF14DRAFT_1779346 [Spinellus fusiger]